MIILAHRGYWKQPIEKNKIISFERSFSLKFGVETDIRDYNGDLVISHDIADSKAISVKQFFSLYNQYKCNMPLALNIKADGLQTELRKLLSEFNITNYFIFDMSVPEGLQYIKQDFSVFTRQSEYELSPSFYDSADGVWLDSFLYDWIDEKIITTHLNNNKKICIVSPELHKRDYIKEWKNYKETERSIGIDLMICTDHPEKARDFFGG